MSNQPVLVHAWSAVEPLTARMACIAAGESLSQLCNNPAVIHLGTCIYTTTVQHTLWRHPSFRRDG